MQIPYPLSRTKDGPSNLLCCRPPWHCHQTKRSITCSHVLYMHIQHCHIWRAKATVGLHASMMPPWLETLGMHRHFGTALPPLTRSGKASKPITPDLFSKSTRSSRSYAVAVAAPAPRTKDLTIAPCSQSRLYFKSAPYSMENGVMDRPQPSIFQRLRHRYTMLPKDDTIDDMRPVTTRPSRWRWRRRCRDSSQAQLLELAP
jgi:hypothetical protein